MQAVILAAGKGTRLHPITANRTKAMAPILGKPIVERVLETLVENGVDECIMVISPEDREIRTHFEDSSMLEIDITFMAQPDRLGMANALNLAAPHIRGDFVLTACDNLTPAEHIAQLIDSHQSGSANATLSLMAVEDSMISRTGIVEMRNGNIIRILEKPALEDAPSNIASLPLYVFSTKLLDLLPEVPLSSRGEYELQDAIQLLIERHGFVTGVFTSTRRQLTSADDLLSINHHFLARDDKTFVLSLESVGSNTQLIAPLFIGKETVIGPGCVIGPNVYIENNCLIGADVHIRDSVILRNTVIEDGRQIVGGIVA